MDSLIIMNREGPVLSFDGGGAGFVRELTAAEIDVVSGAVDWDAVQHAGNVGFVGGAVAGGFAGLVGGMMGTPITAGVSLPVGIGLGAVFGGIGGWYAGAASNLYDQLTQ